MEESEMDIMRKELEMVKLEVRDLKQKLGDNLFLQDDFTSKQIVNRVVVFKKAVIDASGVTQIN